MTTASKKKAIAILEAAGYTELDKYTDAMLRKAVTNVKKQAARSLRRDTRALVRANNQNCRATFGNRSLLETIKEKAGELKDAIDERIEEDKISDDRVIKLIEDTKA